MPPSARPGEPEALLASTGFLLARVGAESRRCFARALAASGIALSHYSLLMTLAAAQCVSQRELGSQTSIDPRNLVALLDQLEQQGLVKRAARPGDRRVRSVSLSAKGRARMRRLARAGARVEREFLAALTPSEQATLRALLRKLYENVI